MSHSALVVVSHYNAWPTAHLIHLLDQIRAVPAGHPFDCVVVVNQAVDRALELPSEHAGVKILYRENTGFNIGAWDHGWRTAPRADYYLFLQEECRIVRPDWLGSVIRRLSKPQVGIVGESLWWAGLTWDRLRRLYRGHAYQVGPGEPPMAFIEGVVRFLKSRNVPKGRVGEHLQSFILATRRDVLEAIDGFLIGGSKGDAISCEIGISRAVAALGLKVEQVGPRPFHFINHLQWAHLDRGLSSTLLRWVDRYAPMPTVGLSKRVIHRLRKILTGEPFDWELMPAEGAEGPVLAPGSPGSDGNARRPGHS